MSWRQNKPEKSGNHGGSKVRIRLLAIFFIVFGFLAIVRLFDLQILKGSFYTALASGQHELYQRLFPERGSVYVIEKEGNKETLFPLVTNHDLYMLYAIPKEIVDPEETAKKVMAIFGLPEEINFKQVEKELFADISASTSPKLAAEIKEERKKKWYQEQLDLEIKKLADKFSRKEDPYEPIRHKLTPEQVEEIKALNIDGLAFQKEVWRFYTEKGLGGHLFGFWGFAGDNRQGKYGLEGYFDQILAGKFGEIHSERDAWGNIIAVGKNSLVEKIDGSDLVLTIDRAVQYKACQALYQAVDHFEAAGGAVVVMNPKTGAILAMCGAPDYNPDEYNKVDDIQVYNNPAIFKAYEPGSIFKVITMAAALDAGKIEPTTTYEDKGEVVYDHFHIKNFNDKIYGRQTMIEVLEKSINTGAIYAMKQTTAKVFTKYVKDFGFGQKTGIELDKEVVGDISNLDRRGEIYAATASFGQGIMVTPLQMLTAVSAIANEGKIMKPYIVSKIISHNKGQDEIEEFRPQEVRQVISPKAAAMLSGMMVSVVESGHGKPAAVPGYRVAGKTGTAQIANKNSGGYSSAVYTSFVGFAPFADPRIAIIVSLDNPQRGREAMVVAAPVFADIAKFALQYYNVPYDNK
ncbi:MAG: penicillin-binding protein 2 [Patescibacteria group bacterium]